MDYSLDNDYVGQRIAAEASADARASFIRRTYGHLAGAILAFAGLEAVLLNSPLRDYVGVMMGSRASWFIVLLAFMGVSWLATSWASSGASAGTQYAGLALYIVAEAIIFLPIMVIATDFAPDVIPKAGIMTLALFAGLSFATFVTRSDFSYLAPILAMGSMLALGFIGMSFFFPGMNIGNWFSFGMVALVSASILYHTSNIMYHYRTDQHVAAALALFASVATMFWYIIQIFMSSSRD